MFFVVISSDEIVNKTSPFVDANVNRCIMAFCAVIFVKYCCECDHIYQDVHTFVCVWNVPAKLNSTFEFLADGKHNACITFVCMYEVPVCYTFTGRKYVLISSVMGTG